MRFFYVACATQVRHTDQEPWLNSYASISIAWEIVDEAPYPPLSWILDQIQSRVRTQTPGVIVGVPVVLGITEFQSEQDYRSFTETR